MLSSLRRRSAVPWPARATWRQRAARVRALHVPRMCSSLQRRSAARRRVRATRRKTARVRAEPARRMPSEPASTVCRSSAGTCDVAESCSGSSASCPADAFEPSSVECRASAGDCDVAESCSGSSASCPTDAFQPNTFECRPSTASCDPVEYCTGAGTSCPTDVINSTQPVGDSLRCRRAQRPRSRGPRRSPVRSACIAAPASTRSRGRTTRAASPTAWRLSR